MIMNYKGKLSITIGDQMAELAQDTLARTLPYPYWIGQMETPLYLLLILEPLRSGVRDLVFSLVSLRSPMI